MCPILFPLPRAGYKAGVKPSLLQIAAAIALLGAVPAARAQPAVPRTLDVAPDAAWQHAGTRMILPPRIGGLTRLHIRNMSSDELVVAAAFADRDEGMTALVHIYRTKVPHVPVWFDSALATIVPPPAGAALPAVTAFARPGASAASGLRAATAGNGPGLRSSAIALAPLGSWLVTIRLDSARLDPAALDERLSAFIAALGWPAETGTASSAIPVEPCPAPLRLTAARRLSGRPHDVVAYWAGWTVLPGEDAGPPRVYCREPGATIRSGVYRLDGASDTYLIPLADGIALAAGEETDLAALMGERRRRRYSVTLVERNSLIGHSSFNRLPPPEQALAAFLGAPPLLSVTTGRERR